MLKRVYRRRVKNNAFGSRVIGIRPAYSFDYLTPKQYKGYYA